MSETEQEPILLRSDQDHIATLTLNRPAKFNALSESLLSELKRTLDDINQDENVRVVILKGNGKAFCAGHDLREMRSNADQQYIRALFSECSAVMKRIGQLPQPVIASVHGMATAAGCQLVGTCDLAVASENATFAVSGINIGLFCSTPAVALSRNVARKHAMEMLMLGDFIDTPKALEIGLINQAVSEGELDATTWAMAEKLAGKLPSALRLGKSLFYQQLNMPIEKAYEVASDAITCNFLNEDTIEGIDAFLEKRHPSWSR
ncbi:MAG: enoyl-CoA hydratase [Gammaproteobacteria bacterium]|nr:enoyl-CoA hydratase [Gammaproteobacteria bacterium]